MKKPEAARLVTNRRVSVSTLTQSPSTIVPQHFMGTNSRIASLDGLRAISFLIVFLAHASGAENLVPGRLGVNMFFLISGYLITLLLIREKARTGWISLKLFYIRRTLRIAPPMYVIFGCTLLFLYLRHETNELSFAGISSQLFYYQNYYHGTGLIPGLGVLWSLAIEEHFYLLFPPLLFLLISRFRLQYGQIALLLLTLCVCILAWRTFVAIAVPGGMRWARDATDCRADSILFGCVLACWEQTLHCRHHFTKSRLVRVFLPSAVVVLLVSLLIRDSLFRETLRYTFQSIALMPILFFAVHNPTSLLGKLLNSGFLVLVGTLSYAMYLIHSTVLLELHRTMPYGLSTGALAFVITFLLAGFTRLSIEMPLERTRSTFFHGRAYQSKSGISGNK